MLRQFKKYIGLGPKDSAGRDSDDSDSMEDVDDDHTYQREIVAGELERELEYEIIRIQDTDQTLREVKCICIECGEDFTQDVMDGETEVVKVRRLRLSNSSEEGEQIDRSNTVLSPEGYCLNCEIRKRPDRFHGCAFCRRPLRDLFACTTCRIGFAEWIRDVIPPETIILKSVREQAKRIVTGIIESGYIDNREFLYRESQLMCRWPGFYAGPLNVKNEKGKSSNNSYLPTWVIPDYIEIPNETRSLSISTDLTRITRFEMFEKKLMEILEYNHIYIFQNIQIDVSKMDISNIREVNPYDLSILS
jgi:hypothetical protein